MIVDLAVWPGHGIAEAILGRGLPMLFVQAVSKNFLDFRPGSFRLGIQLRLPHRRVTRPGRGRLIMHVRYQRVIDHVRERRAQQQVSCRAAIVALLDFTPRVASAPLGAAHCLRYRRRALARVAGHRKRHDRGHRNRLPQGHGRPCRRRCRRRAGQCVGSFDRSLLRRCLPTKPSGVAEAGWMERPSCPQRSVGTRGLGSGMVIVIGMTMGSE